MSLRSRTLQGLTLRLVDLWHQILEFFGVIGESGKGYGFWSGVGSDIGELAIVGSLLGLLRARNCHIDGCWRLGRHAVEGTPYIVCRRHHPDDRLTHADLLTRYRAAKAHGSEPTSDSREAPRSTSTLS